MDDDASGCSLDTVFIKAASSRIVISFGDVITSLSRVRVSFRFAKNL